MSQRLRDKVVLVTGASSGLGRAIASGMAAEGAYVILSDIDEEGGTLTTQDILRGGGKAEYIELDVAQPEAWGRIEQHIEQTHGRLDVLVNNAGIGMLKPFEETDFSEWRQLMSINLDGAFLGMMMAMRLMKKSSAGSIINMSSIFGLVGDGFSPAYNASKGGLTMLTKSAALYCSHRGYKIRCNSIHPGFINTRIAENAIMGVNDEDLESVQTRWLGSIPMGEPGEPEDIVGGAIFLACDESRYMNGSELVIDGGFTAQ